MRLGSFGRLSPCECLRVLLTTYEDISNKEDWGVMSEVLRFHLCLSILQNVIKQIE